MWYYTYQGHQLGPVDINGLKNLMRSEIVNGATMIWREGWDDWKRLNETDLIWLFEEIKGQPLVSDEDPKFAISDVESDEFDGEEETDEEEKIWYYQQDGYSRGPLGASAMQRLLREGDLEDITLVRRNGEVIWHHLDETDLIWLLQDDEEVSADEGKDEEEFEDQESEETADLEDPIEEEEQVWYYIIGDRVYGPATTEEILVMRSHGEVDGQTQISENANGPWIMLGKTELANQSPDLIGSEEEE